MMLDYHRNQYVGCNIVVSVAGNIEHDEVVDQVDELLSDMPRGEPRGMFPYDDNLVGPSVTGGRRELEQLHMALASKGSGWTTCVERHCE